MSDKPEPLSGEEIVELKDGLRALGDVTLHIDLGRLVATIEQLCAALVCTTEERDAMRAVVERTLARHELYCSLDGAEGRPKYEEAPEVVHANVVLSSACDAYLAGHSALAERVQAEREVVEKAKVWQREWASRAKRGHHDQYHLACAELFQAIDRLLALREKQEKSDAAEG